ncbi:MAG: twin-arginine translocase subunit TatB [Rhodocyclaceae bacterium]|nr:twin-arginine translocase subunit TatB [Rhodocyclaceae bacterium]
MFDIGFSELMLIGLVALIVIGPERLPKVARTVGHVLGRVQRYVADVKSDIRREIQLDELKKLQTEMQDSARQFETTLREEVSEVKSSLDQSTADARASIAELEAQLAEARAVAGQAAAPPSAAAEPEGGAGPQLELGLERDRGPGKSG